MKRSLDLILSVIALSLLCVPMLVIALLIKATSAGPIFFCSNRVGRNNKLFNMYKFRSMVIDTPLVATDLLKNPSTVLTPIGSFLRTTSLDELPQIFNILLGDMSFVGPRPALFNQVDLINLRTQLGVHELMPGLTGWAQINGRDDITIEKKVCFDTEYLTDHSFMLDIKILWLTLVKVTRREGVSH